MAATNNLLDLLLVSKVNSRKDLRQQDLKALILDYRHTQNSLTLKIRTHLLQRLTEILLRATVLLKQDITDFETQTFYAQKKNEERRAGGGGGGTRRKKKKRVSKGNEAQRALQAMQQNADRLIDGQLSSQKHTADKADINLPNEIPNQIIDQPQSGSDLKRNSNFKQLLDNTSFQNLQPQHAQTFNELVPPSADKYSIRDHILKNMEQNISRLSIEYKDLLDTTYGEASTKPISVRKTRKKTAAKPQKIAYDERINTATNIQDVEEEQDRKETKRKLEDEQETRAEINPTEIVAPQLLHLTLQIERPKTEESRSRLYELQKSVLLNESLNNTLFGQTYLNSFNYEIQNVRGVDSQKKLIDFLTANKSLSSGPSDNKRDSLGSVGNLEIQEPVQPTEGPNLTTIMETFDLDTRSPTKRPKLTQTQKQIAQIVLGHMKQGQTNLNKMMQSQAMPKRFKALLFYEVLNLNFQLRQENAQAFSDIFVMYP